MTSKLDASRLEALLESAQLLQSSLELDTVLKHLLRTVMGRLLARRGLIAVRRPEGTLQLALVRGASMLSAGAEYIEEAAQAAGIERVLPIGNPAEPTGLLGLGAYNKNVEAEESEFIEALLGLAASVISNAQALESARHANQALDQRLQELRALLDLGRGLAATFEPEEVARLAALTIAGRWAVSKYAVVAWREGQPLVLRQKGLDLSNPEPWKLQVASLSDALIASGEGDPPVPAGSLLLPIRANEATFGLLVAGPRLRGATYSEADIEFGTGLAAQAAVALDNAWNFKETVLKRQLEKELTLAASIQNNLFPAKLPDLAGFEIAARNRQARQVGGDYYDALPITGPGADQPHLFCVADISGKGLSAALLMSTIQATLRALLAPSTPLLEVAGRANDLLYATTPANKFATAFLVALDPRTGAFRYVNCGHNAAVLLRASGEHELLDGPGLALGLFPKRTQAELDGSLCPGDILVIYSDGVTEAQNLAEDEFEMDRLVDCLRRNSGCPARDIVDCIFAEIDAFAGGAPQFDDITLMVVKRTCSPA
ncbi:MAG: GAF domain-containing SpoIIE family protein phosphatase [Bryobacteraceae bacterium]|nr:GAF domain-containing SpoIIE family protein phosphatase [Bryobacteraceae bacterium]